MVDVDYRVIFYLSGPPEGSFEWQGCASSPAAAESEARAALLSVLQAAIGTDDANAIGLEARSRTQRVRDLYDYEWQLPPVNLFWRISHFDDMFALKSRNNNEVRDIRFYSNRVRNIVYSDPNVLCNLDLPAIQVNFYDDRNIYGYAV